MKTAYYHEKLPQYQFPSPLGEMGLSIHGVKGSKLRSIPD